MNSVMKGLLAFGASLVIAGQVSAANFIAADCTSTVTSPTYDKCAGAYAGNDVGNQGTALQYLNDNDVFGGSDDWSLTGEFNNEPEDTTLFSVDNLGQTSGSINFDMTLQELADLGDIVLSLKAGNFYSMFYWAGPLESLVVEWTTLGVATNLEGSNSPGLSHVALFTRATTTEVPEPATLALLGLGLAGLRIARKRS